MADNKYYGIYPAYVSNINDPEKRGRIKCYIPDVLDIDVESAWCEPCIPVAYDYGGDFCLPELKEGVWLMFRDGDPNTPVYLGGWWQENQTPLGSNYDNLDNFRIISYAGCKITLEDGSIKINVDDGDAEIEISEGTVTINGDLTVTGDINADGDVTASDVSLVNHKHGGVESGSSNTSKPV